MESRYGTQGAVQLYGEEVVGDGYSMFFDKETGKLVQTTEYDSAGEGYATALEDTGVAVEVYRLEEGDLNWQEAGDWFSKVRDENWDIILESGKIKGVSVTRTKG